MMEAQRYPEDFDAIIAGAPVYNVVHLNVSQVALQVGTLKEPSRIVPSGKVTLLANAVVAACDEKDGVKDHQRPPDVQVRSGCLDEQGWRCGGLPDSRASREREERILAGSRLSSG
jgi:hypothetical protein